MGNRKLPFGYMMERGEIIPHPEERNCVCMIFDEYQKGISYNVLVARLEKNGVPYDTEKSWNKNMVARILENRRYMGEQSYPPIMFVVFCALERPVLIKPPDSRRFFPVHDFGKVCDFLIEMPRMMCGSSEVLLLAEMLLFPALDTKTADTPILDNICCFG